MINCNADLDHPCDAGLDLNGESEPCDSCKADMEYWRGQYQAFGKARNICLGCNRWSLCERSSGCCSDTCLKITLKDAGRRHLIA